MRLLLYWFIGKAQAMCRMNRNINSAWFVVLITNNDHFKIEVCTRDLSQQKFTKKKKTITTFNDFFPTCFFVCLFRSCEITRHYYKCTWLLSIIRNLFKYTRKESQIYHTPPLSVRYNERYTNAIQIFEQTDNNKKKNAVVGGIYYESKGKESGSCSTYRYW